MTNEELKKKIVDILVNCKSQECAVEYCATSEGNPCIEHCREKEQADALIAAGLRFGENFTATFDLMALEREHELERRLAEAEHRAEVAEKALKDCIDYYSYSGLCPVLDCNYNKACWRKECTSDIEKCFMIQAEKELAEDIDD